MPGVHIRRRGLFLWRWWRQFRPEKELHRVVLDPLHQLLEHPERLRLVLDQRITLAIGTESDTAA